MATSDQKNRKIPLNIYLIKKNPDEKSKGLWDQGEILARPIGQSGRPKKIRTDEFKLGKDGELGTLHIRKPVVEAEPEWISFVEKDADNPAALKKLRNKSVSSLIIIESNSRQFAIPFGHGRFMIEPDLIEERFGIRTVLNSVSPDRIASIDRQTFDASPRISRTQTIKASSVSDYMISADQDLLKGLVGFSKPIYSEKIGEVIAGIDSFKTSMPIRLTDLKILLNTALERSESKDFLKPNSNGTPSGFAWVENLLPITNKEQISSLDDLLWKQIIAGNLGNMWLAIPEILDWSQITGFSYKADHTETELDNALSLEKFLATLRRNASIKTIKSREIFIIRTNNTPAQRFKAYKCLYAEIHHSGSLFILNSGTWYKVDQSFQRQVESYFLNVPRKKIEDTAFFEYSHDGEGPYNTAVCIENPETHALLDRDMIKFGGSYDKIEVCDVYHNDQKNKTHQFIHVKRGRSSATLSHLFSQGLVSSTLLIKEGKFVDQVNIQLKSQSFPPLETPFSTSRKEIIFAIIDGPKNKPLDLPFFSKVTLQNCGKSISAFGYTIHLLHIPESDSHLAKAAENKKIKREENKLKKKPTNTKARK